MSEEQHHAPESGLVRALLGKAPIRHLLSEKVLLWIMLGLAFLLPVFFIPGQTFAPEFAKMLLLEIGVLVAVFLWAAGRLRDGSIEIPKSLLLLVSFLLVLQFVASAIVSPTPLLSFIGSGFDLGTVNSFAILFLLMFMASTIFSNRDNVLKLYMSFFAAGALLLVYHLARYVFGADFLAFGIFTSDVATPVGRWNDFAAFVGALMLLLLTTLYFFPQNARLRAVAIAVFIVGLFFLLSVNFVALWFILVVLSALLIALSIYEGERDHGRRSREAAQSGAHHAHRPIHRRIPGHLSALTVVLFLVALIYASGLASVTWGKDGASIGAYVERTLRVTPYGEVVLTPQFTFDIVKSTLSESPFFGTGPNRFSSAYLKYKLGEINTTAFWDTTFEYGLGRIPTFFGTTGVIGMILWIFFVALIFIKGRKIFRLLEKDRVAAYIGFSLFILTLYFWTLAFFYLPNIALFALAFLFTGALIATLVGEGVLERYRLTFAGGSRLSMVLTPVAIVVLVGVVASGIMLYRQTASLVLFREAQVASNVGNLEQAEQALTRANGYAERDLYRRALSNVALVKLQALANQQLSQDALAAQASQLIDAARTNAERAIVLDPTNFENYLQYGGVFDALGNLGVQNTTPFARENYERALVLNPKSPRVLFLLSHIEFVGGDRAKSKEYLRRALAERPNFVEALSFFVQLSLEDGNMEEAVNAVRAAIQIEPTNFVFRFALGYLYYFSNSLTQALPEFEAAVILNPTYADAKFFLGLTYARLTRIDDAIRQFSEVQTLNPDNQQVAAIIRQLKSGNLSGLNAGTPSATQALPSVTPGR